ncbi:MAG TPA: FAD-binding protein, partial [Ilumatobacter sp.]|nr:FAD-binding protein [Ilumatobacter sp.]
MTLLPHVPATRSEAIGQLRDALTGSLLAPGDPSYDEVRRAGPTPWPSPVVIVLATGTDDIVQAVRFARSQHVSVAVRSSGQRAGAAADGAVLIDTSRIDRVVVDLDCHTAVVGAGATWARVVAETDRH